jgi:hypothetical protein
MDPEPSYVEDPFEEDLPPLFGPRRPRWMVPQSEFEKMVLGAFGMSFYPRKVVAYRETNSKQMRSRLIEIGKSMVSLESGLDAIYPTEWVMEVLKWYRDHQRRGWAGLRAFLRSMGDVQWRDDFVAKWRAEHPDYSSPPVDNYKDYEKHFRLPGKRGVNEGKEHW